MAKEKSDVEVVKIEGNVRSAYSTTEKDEQGEVNKVTNIVSLYSDGLTVDGSEKVSEFFEGLFSGVSNKKYIPSWFKESKDYIVLKSKFNIPCKIDDTDEQFSWIQFVERGNINNAHVIVKCNVKNNTIYPSCMLILSEGEPYDAFKDF